ncbi:MAG: molecular chaperone HtpG, partial [Clostridiales bacterium]|nr:molecular chaperone HtpG [Clostridiales bacterium]
VGFYSAFMVAKQVTVVSKAYGSDEAYSWTSDGVEGYTIKPAERESFGTSVILELKDNSEEENLDSFLSEYGLKSLIKKYSNYVRYPIQMEVTKSRTLPVPDDAPEGTVPEREEYTELETINSMIPIWKRSKSDVTDQEYAEYYKSDYHDYADPLRTIKVHAEGALEYDALMFIPSRAPFDYYSRDFKSGLQLYSSNVKIMDKCEELLPEYFGFVQGLVDSPDLSLNISREMLQHDRQLTAIANNLKKKIQSELLKMLASQRDKYETFYKAFSQPIKYGVYAMYGMDKDFLKDLLLYYSAKEEKLVTLKEYVEKMPEEQKYIYYAAGDSLSHVLHMPQTEQIRDKGYDILCMTDDVDEFAIRILDSYEGKSFKSASDSDLELSTEEEKKAMEEKKESSKDLLERMKKALEGKVKDVRLSDRLKKSAACLNGDGGLSVEMYKVLKSMPNGGELPASFVLELNPDHPLFAKLGTLSDEELGVYANLLYDQSLLMAGLPLEDPAAFCEQVWKLM